MSFERPISDPTVFLFLALDTRLSSLLTVVLQEVVCVEEDEIELIDYIKVIYIYSAQW